MFSLTSFSSGELSYNFVNIEEFDVQNNIDKVVEEAKSIGRSGNVLKDNYVILFRKIFPKKMNFLWLNGLMQKMIRNLKNIELIMIFNFQKVIIMN